MGYKIFYKVPAPQVPARDQLLKEENYQKGERGAKEELQRGVYELEIENEKEMNEKSITWRLRPCGSESALSAKQCSVSKGSNAGMLG